MARAHKEGILSRWSRLKLDSAHAADKTQESALPEVVDTDGEAVPAVDVKDSPERTGEAPTELPSIEELGPDSDFRGFMNPEIDDDLRRAALKKLFSDPHFNVTDGLDVYAEDYTKLESMTPAMVAGLKHAQRLLFSDRDKDKEMQTPTRIAQRPAGEQPVTVPGETGAVLAEDQHEERGAGETAVPDDEAGKMAGATPPIATRVAKKRDT